MHENMIPKNKDILNAENQLYLQYQGRKEKKCFVTTNKFCFVFSQISHVKLP